LLHIFSNEWKNEFKKNIWKSIIKNKLSFSEKIYARKCKIQMIDVKTKNKFLNENHLQGEDKSSVYFGLYYEDQLVSIMTFGTPRYNKNYEWEIIRFCNKLNTVTMGTASKLLAHFEETYKPKSIITYADLRYSNGNLYKNLGFTLLHTSQPNYFYINVSNLQIITRLNAQKHKLKNIPNFIFDPTLSEAQNMFTNKFRRIWDCGHLVFSKPPINN
jgi:hypothetical protein